MYLYALINGSKPTSPNNINVGNKIENEVHHSQTTAVSPKVLLRKTKSLQHFRSSTDTWHTRYFNAIDAFYRIPLEYRNGLDSIVKARDESKPRGVRMCRRQIEVDTREHGANELVRH